MNEQDYIKNRVDDQFDYYDNKSIHNKKMYQFYKVIVILLSVSIPLMTGFITDDTTWLKVAVGVAGVIIALIEGIQSLYKYHDNWLHARNAAEFLKREKIYYATKSGPYATGGSLQKFVERVEAFTSEENKSWAILTKEEKAEDNSEEETEASDEA